MVRAILAGRKTQTRRVVKEALCKDSGVPVAACEIVAEVNGGDFRLCPYGAPGDTLWVRETFSQSPDGIIYRATQADHGITECDDSVKYKPSIHMPRWASRITLRVTGVRVERLQDISESDAEAEGVVYHDGRGIGHSGWRPNHDFAMVGPTPIHAFAWRWQSINGPESWAANPWVWVVEFEKEARHG